MSEFIGKGTYGCVFRPSINCDGTIGGEKTVSKFFLDKKDYLNELKLQKVIDKIDVENKFTVKKISNCKVKITQELKKEIKNFDKCYNLSNDIYQITYEYGGYDLYRLFKYDKDKIKDVDLSLFLKKFLTIFEGLSILDRNQLLHFDIRSDNILYDPEKMKFVIIDFGLMKSRNNIFSYDLFSSFHKNPHLNYPNEFVLFYFIVNKKEINKFKLNSYSYIEFNQNKINALKTLDKFDLYVKKFNEIFDYLINDINTNLKETLKIFKNLEYTFNDVSINRKTSLICSDIKSKIDVYMLGIVLLDLLFYIFIFISSNPTISSIPLSLFDLIKKMISLNPCNRPTIQEAMKEFKELMKISSLS